MNTIFNLDPLLTVEDREDILQEPVVVRVTKFDSEAVEDFEEDMSEAHNTGQPVIPVIIDSYGGSVYGCRGMVDVIEQARLPVATIVRTKAMSAGAILFSFGTEGYRFMAPDATIMIHDIADIMDGKIEDIKEDVKHLEFLNQTMYKKMAKHLGHPEDYILDLLRKNRHLDLYLTAKDAKKHKLANHLHTPTLEVNVSVTYKFG
jgi:ATP-dependent Clp endopeptidase proteolytic subunit ClpP